MKEMIDDKTKLETIVSEYEKSQKHIKEVWLGEGWYKTTPNSFDYFASGFEAGLNYQYLTKEEIEAIKYFASFQWTMLKPHTKTLNSLLERINHGS